MNIQEQLNIQIESQFHGYFGTVMNVKKRLESQLGIELVMMKLDEIRRSFINQSGFINLSNFINQRQILCDAA